MRNGLIELLRFVFAACIVCTHARFFTDDFPFKGGWHSVEFFFVVTGYLMARSIEKKKQQTPEPDNLAVETTDFIIRKVKGFAPEFIVAWIIGFVFCIIVDGNTGFPANILSFADGFLEIFLIKMTGVMNTYSVNGATWYLSAMLIGLIIIYPLVRRYTDIMVRIVLPLLTLFILGYFFRQGAMGGSMTWYGFVYKGTLRGFCGISLGVICYHAFSPLKNKQLTLFSGILVTFMTMGIVVTFLYYMNAMEKSQRSYLALFCLVFAIGLIFSNKGHGQKIFNNRLCYFLGKFSLPLYLSHYFYATRMNQYAPEGLTNTEKLLLYYSLAVVTAAVVMGIASLYRRNAKQIKSAVQRVVFEGN